MNFTVNTPQELINLICFITIKAEFSGEKVSPQNPDCF